MQQVKNGDKIKVHYQGRLTDGTIFDSSEGREPLAFEVGSGTVIPGFDKGVTGMQVGEKKTITIPVEDAYGPFHEEMLMEFPINQFPPGMKPEIGMQLNMSDDNGEQFMVKIAGIEEDVVLLDGNHPLAGHDLIFDLDLVEIEGRKSLIIIP